MKSQSLLWGALLQSGGFFRHSSFYIFIFYKHTGGTVEWPVVIKSKPLDSETAAMINKMAQACGLELAVQYERYKLETGFRYECCIKCHNKLGRVSNFTIPRVPNLLCTLANINMCANNEIHIHICRMKI